jgi:tetrahydromethanopterin S-methyltransferase subunit G
MPTVKGAVEWTTAKTSQFLDRLDRVLEDAVELLPGTVAAFSELIGASWSIIYVAVIGILLVLLRNWFFDNADSLAQSKLDARCHCAAHV